MYIVRGRKNFEVCAATVVAMNKMCTPCIGPSQTLSRTGSHGNSGTIGQHQERQSIGRQQLHLVTVAEGSSHHKCIPFG